jgi:hypothetical protein
MAAPIIGTVDQEIANARGAHFAQGDLLLAGEGGHVPLKRDLSGQIINLRAKPGDHAVRFGCILTRSRSDYLGCCCCCSVFGLAAS